MGIGNSNAALGSTLASLLSAASGFTSVDELTPLVVSSGWLGTLAAPSDVAAKLGSIKAASTGAVVTGSSPNS